MKLRPRGCPLPVMLLLLPRELLMLLGPRGSTQQFSNRGARFGSTQQFSNRGARFSNRREYAGLPGQSRNCLEPRRQPRIVALLHQTRLVSSLSKSGIVASSNQPRLSRQRSFARLSIRRRKRLRLILCLLRLILCLLRLLPKWEFGPLAPTSRPVAINLPQVEARPSRSYGSKTRPFAPPLAHPLAGSLTAPLTPFACGLCPIALASVLSPPLALALALAPFSCALALVSDRTCSSVNRECSCNMQQRESRSRERQNKRMTPSRSSSSSSSVSYFSVYSYEFRSQISDFRFQLFRFSGFIFQVLSWRPWGPWHFTRARRLNDPVLSFCFITNGKVPYGC